MRSKRFQIFPGILLLLLGWSIVARIGLPIRWDSLATWVHLFLTVIGVSWLVALRGHLSTAWISYIVVWASLGIEDGSLRASLPELWLEVIGSCWILFRTRRSPAAQSRSFAYALIWGLAASWALYAAGILFYGAEILEMRRYMITVLRTDRWVLAARFGILALFSVIAAYRASHVKQGEESTSDLLAHPPFEKRFGTAGLAIATLLALGFAAFISINVSRAIIRYRTNPAPVPTVPEAKLGRKLVTALIASEDPTFFEHRGVEPRAIDSAIAYDWSVRRLERGASTISMQLAKVFYLSSERTFSRKIQQVAIALLLEKRFTKDELLRIYVQSVDLGLDHPGLVHAARVYYDKAPTELSNPEIRALLNAIPNPRLHDPRRAPDYPARGALYPEALAGRIEPHLKEATWIE